jgi:hypothetical protein
MTVELLRSSRPSGGPGRRQGLRLPSPANSIAVPVLLAAVLAVVYVLAPPAAGDLAAQTARAQLFSRSGYVPWWTGWYGGTPTTSYSLTTPFLLGWFGPVWSGALALVATPVAAVPLLARARRPAWGGCALVLTAAADVVVGRTTFAAGVVLVLCSFSLACRRHASAAFVLAVVATLTSPIAGVLAMVPAVAGVASDSGRRRAWCAVVVGTACGLALLWGLAAGHAAGYEPFGRASLLPVLTAAAVLACLPVGRTLRLAAALAAAAMLIVFFSPTAIGTNVTRLALLAALPAAVANARLSRRYLAVAAAVLAVTPVGNLFGELATASSAGGSEQFVAGLRGQLLSLPGIAGVRVEIVDVASHWPQTRLLPAVEPARGWERQTDAALNPEFYQTRALNPSSYRAFLDRNAVAYVAVPIGAPLDFAAIAEAALVNAGLPYLQQVWSDRHWKLYAVHHPAPLIAGPPATDVRLTDTGVNFTSAAPGDYTIRLGWSPYLVVTGGTVTRAAAGAIAVHVGQAGSHEVHAEWRLP